MTVQTVTTPDGVVTIEPAASILRYHESGGYGDPYSFSCVMTRYGDEATLFAAGGRIRPQVRRAVAAALRELGITKIRYQRRNAGGARKLACDL